jgi:saccharopine dehydrogenase-like NADP-dependent oxidoreductase
LLLAKTDLDLIIAGRHKDLAESLSRNLNQDLGCRTEGAYVDASDPASLLSAFADADMVIAASTTAQYTERVARAAIKIGIDYLDIHHPQRNVPVLMNLAPEIKNAGLCFITQAGFYPGLPSVLTRFASMFFTRYRKSVVEVAMNTQFDKGGSLDEFIDSLGDYSAEVFKGGKWEQGGPRDWVKIDFGSSIGSKICYPMTMVEMKALPGALGLEEAGVYAAGLNWFVDYLVTPAAVALGKVRGIGQRFFGFTNGLGLDDFLR